MTSSEAVAAPAKTARPASEHIPSLDGLRAISIAGVLFGHLYGTRNFGRPELGVGDVAHLGVIVFLVISGYLITRLLLNEHERNGRISLKLFYARRSLRIFPASFAYIGCIGLLSAAGLFTLQRYDLLHAITYTVNYAPVSWQLGHLWSLSVEEQFYLLWPFTFLALGPRRASMAAGAVLFLGVGARLAFWYFTRGTTVAFPMVADSLAAGCVLARLQGWLETQRWYMRLFHPAISLGMAALILLLNRLMGFTVVMVFGTAAINFLIAVLIHRSVLRPKDWAGRLLNARPVAFLGALSYSLYLWQQLFIDRHSAGWAHAFPQNLLLTVTAALASYLLLEKPLMRLRRRLRA